MRKREGGGGLGEGRTFWRREVNDVAVLLEHVHLLYRLYRLDVQFLEGSLQLLVVGSGGFVDLFNFSPWCAFATT